MEFGDVFSFVTRGVGFFRGVVSHFLGTTTSWPYKTIFLFQKIQNYQTNHKTGLDR